MSNSLAEQLFQQLQGAPLQQLSQQLGTGQTETSLAQRFLGGQQGSAASPAVLGQALGLEHQAAQQQGGLGGGLLGAVLDQDGDGQLGLGDLLKMGGGLLGGGR